MPDSQSNPQPKPQSNPEPNPEPASAPQPVPRGRRPALGAMPAAEVDARFAALRQEVTLGVPAPSVVAMVRRGVRRRRRRRAAGLAGTGLLAAAVVWGGLQLPSGADGHNLSRPIPAVVTAPAWPLPDPAQPVIPSPGPSGGSSGGGRVAALPLDVQDVPGVAGVPMDWVLRAVPGGVPGAPDTARDQPGCLAGPVESLGAALTSGQDYRDPTVDSAQGYQYVLDFTDVESASRAALVIEGGFGCKGGHGSLAKVAEGDSVIVLREGFQDGTGLLVTSVEQFTVRLWGTRVAVLGVRRIYQPGEDGYRSPLGVPPSLATASLTIANWLIRTA